ncbi:hypothetical protein, partial [Methanolobus psychrotolerans]|uniref:hypothetical protein n=1 Tax=Methanolobus psychrotolerans TaxID=1874706 RepID=UPI001A914A8B
FSCYIKVALSLAELPNTDNLVFFVENQQLRLCFVDNFLKSNYIIKHIESRRSAILESINDNVEFIVKHSWFALSNICRMLLVKHIYFYKKIDYLSKKDSSKEDLVLIHSWIDGRSFTENNEFQDVYFGKLNSYISKSVDNIVIVPYILHTVSYWKMLTKISKCREHFLIHSAHLSMSNILSVLLKTMKRPTKEKCLTFENIDISHIIYLDRLNDWKNTRMSSNLLLYRVIENLKLQSLSIDRFIFLHENHTWEKIYCLAFRDFYPNTLLLGYQHSTISKMYTAYSISQYERELMPFPDILITNGKYSRDYLVKSGYEPTKLIRGGAIRYEYVLDMLKEPTNHRDLNDPDKKVTILVALSIDKNESCELLHKVLDTFGNHRMYDIILKFHPLMQYRVIMNEMNIQLFPEHFTVSNESISSLLNECDILLYMTTTICVEALAAGVYPIHIKSSYNIDCDILDGSPAGLHMSVKSKDELLTCINNFTNLTPDELQKIRNIGRNITKDIFGAVDENTYELFLKTPPYDFID